MSGAAAKSIPGERDSKRLPTFWLAATSAALVATFSPVAEARPQVTASLNAGLCGSHTDSESELCFFSAARAEVLWLRQSGSDVGIGPMLEVGSHSLTNLRVHPGASLLIPAGQAAVVVSGAPYLSLGTDRHLGVSSRLFIGIRNFNRTGHYSAAAGLLAGMDLGLSGPAERAWIVAAQVDAMWLVFGSMVFWRWATGPSE